MSIDFQSAYVKANFWRTGWTRKSIQIEPGQLQAKADRIEHRARLADLRVRSIIREHGQGLAMARQAASGAPVESTPAASSPSFLPDPSLKGQIQAAKKAMEEANGVYWRLKATCTHELREVNESAVCHICESDCGWWCPDSPSHLCTYSGNSEYCVHCGAPEERL